MSSSGISVDSAAGAPLSITGLGSGLDTTSIISAMMAAERAPVTHLSDEQMKVQAQQTALKGIQSSLQQLAFAASEFTLPSLFESSQAVTSSEPLRVSATTSTGAGIGGYEVEVTQLANSAQRTFTFTSPEAEDTVTIDGQEYALKAGASAKELASKINSSSTATVYAAALENGTVVLSSRSTGNTGTEFIQVSDTGGALSEVVGTAKEGKDAEFTVDGVAGTSSSNTVTTAIAGVTLSLEGLTPSGPVTIDVQAPGPSAAKVEAQVQAFVKQYNTTVEEIEQQVNTKPLSKPQVAGEYAIGILFGDEELTNLLSTMRRTMYEPIAGLSAEMSSPARRRREHRRANRHNGLAHLDRRAAETRTVKAHRSRPEQPLGRRHDAATVVSEPAGHRQRRRRPRRRDRRDRHRRHVTDLRADSSDQQHERNTRRARKSAAGDICPARSGHLAEHRAGQFHRQPGRRLDRSETLAVLLSSTFLA